MLTRFFSRFYITLLLLGVGFLACWYLLPFEKQAINATLLGFPDSIIWLEKLRLPLLILFFFLPVIAWELYKASSLLHRYTCRQFFEVFLLCMGGLLSIFIVADLSSRVSDFSEHLHPLGFALRYYMIFLPGTAVFILPYVLLLSSLYALAKMSRFGELVAMIQTGKSIWNLSLPFFFFGLFFSLATFLFGYHWGPWIENNKDRLLQQISGKNADSAQAVSYWNKDKKRIWLVGAFPHHFETTHRIDNVLVQIMTSQGKPFYQLKAKHALWSPKQPHWRFEDAEEYHLLATPLPKLSAKHLNIDKNWEETPWQIVKPGLAPQYLSLPQLSTWLAAHHSMSWTNKRPYQTQWHARFAQPLLCLVIILLATPLGMHLSSRKTASSIASAFLIGGLMLFSSSFFLTLGESGKIPPFLGAWSTNILFSLLAFYLFYRRMAGYPIYASIKRLLVKIK